MVIRPIVLVFSLFLALLFRYTDAQILAASDYRQDSLIRLGDSLLIFENFTGAQSVYRQALQKMDKGKDVAGSLYALTRLARTAIEMKDTLNARDYLEKADRIGGDHSLTELERGLTHKEWAVYYDKTGQDSLAKSQFERSLDMLGNCCADHTETMGQVYLEYGDFLFNNDPQQAEEMVRMAIDRLSQSTGIVDLQLGAAYITYGALVRDRGETELRTNYVMAAEQILEKYPAPPFGLVIKVYFEKAVQYVDEDRFSNAAGMFQTIIDLLTTKYGSDWKHMTVYKINLAAVYVEMKDSRAIHVLNDLKIRHIRVKNPDLTYLAIIHHTLGRHYVNENKWDSAHFYFTSALQKYAVPSDSVSISRVYHLMAEMNLLAGYADQALALSDLSLSFTGYSAREIFDPSVLESQNIDLYFGPMELRGRILQELFHASGDESALHEALRISSQIEQIAEFTRNGSYTEETKQIVSHHFHLSAQTALRTLVSLHKLTPEIEYITSAFNFMEHNRYAQLFRDLNRSQALSSTGSEDSISHRFNAFAAEIQRLNLKISQSTTRKLPFPELSDSLLRLKEAFQIFQEEVKNKYPAEYQIRYDSMFTLFEIQEKIEPRTQLFEFLWGNSEFYLLTLTRDTSLLVSLPLSEIKPVLDRILPWLVSGYVPDTIALTYRQFAALSYGLYKSLIAPYLQKHIDRLVISADGPLANLPFGILVTDTAGIDKASFTTSYLVNTAEIQYAYSSNLLFKQPARDPLRAPEVFAMAYSTGQEDDGAMSRQGFGEIPHSAREIEAIRARFKRANVYDLKGREATKDAFLSLSPQYDIIHLAVHGVGDTISSLNSHLVFKSVSGSEDSRLFAYELYNIPTPKWRMAVLSSCETGVGKAYKGEGIFSIARGFAYAGAPTQVMSLWQANDQTTEWMMDYFYHHLNQGVTVSKALQLAQIDFLQQVDPEYTRPYFWAGFVVMGDVTPVVSRSWPWYYYVLSLLLIISIYLVIRQVYLVRTTKPTEA